MADNDNGAVNPTGGQPAGQPTGQPTPAPAGGPNPNPGGQPNPAAGGTKQFTYTEDRTDWVPRHRLNEQGTKLTAAEQRAQQLEAQLAERDRKIQALAGVTPKNPREAEEAELREVILKLHPKLALLENLDEDAIDRIINAANVAETSAQQSWGRHANTMLGHLDASAAKVLGIDKLDDETSDAIRRAFREEGRKAELVRQGQVKRGDRQSVQTEQGDNDFIARFERGDEALVTEFAQKYLGRFIEPVRRSVTADLTRRNRPVPRSGDRSRNPLVQGQETLDLNKNTDFKKALLAARSQEGNG